MSKRRRPDRAAERNAQRAAANALARGATIQQAPPPPPKRARHCSPLELMLSRGAISETAFRAGVRLAVDFRMAGAMPTLIARYAPGHRTRGHQAAPDTPSSIEARERFELALRACGVWLTPILIHSVCLELSPADWARAQGRPAPDGVAVLRVALDALVAHYRGYQPEPVRLVEIELPAALTAVESKANGSSPPVVPPVEHDASPTIRDFLACQALGDLASDELLDRAIAFAKARGWLSRRCKDPIDAEWKRAGQRMQERRRERRKAIEAAAGAAPEIRAA